MANQEEIYKKITDRVIEMIETNSDLKWLKGWKGIKNPSNYRTEKNYGGINLFNLFIHMTFFGFENPYYLTFNQIKELGGKLKKGSKGMPILYFNYTKYNLKICNNCHLTEKNCDCKNPDFEQKEFTKSFVRGYTVFNYEQTENLKDKNIDTNIEFNPINECEEIVKNYQNKPRIQHEEQSAFYNKIEDFVNMPKQESFFNVEEYYSTLFHELTHSTGHESRLNRPSLMDSASFGSENYSYEELVAEMGSIFLCAKAGIENKTLNNSSAYLKGWIKAMKEDSKTLFKATKEAQKSTEFILN